VFESHWKPCFSQLFFFLQNCDLRFRTAQLQIKTYRISLHCIAHFILYALHWELTSLLAGRPGNEVSIPNEVKGFCSQKVALRNCSHAAPSPIGKADGFAAVVNSVDVKLQSSSTEDSAYNETSTPHMFP